MARCNGPLPSNQVEIWLVRYIREGNLVKGHKTILKQLEYFRGRAAVFEAKKPIYVSMLMKTYYTRLQFTKHQYN